jgi:hypothetical protein
LGGNTSTAEKETLNSPTDLEIESSLPTTPLAAPPCGRVGLSGVTVAGGGHGRGTDAPMFVDCLHHGACAVVIEKKPAAPVAKLNSFFENCD